MYRVRRHCSENDEPQAVQTCINPWEDRGYIGAVHGAARVVRTNLTGVRNSLKSRRYIAAEARKDLCRCNAALAVEGPVFMYRFQRRRCRRQKAAEAGPPSDRVAAARYCSWPVTGALTKIILVVQGGSALPPTLPVRAARLLCRPGKDPVQGNVRFDA